MSYSCVPTPLVHFGSFHLSADGSHLLYIAERKKADSVSYFRKQDHLEDDKDTPVKVSYCEILQVSNTFCGDQGEINV